MAYRLTLGELWYQLASTHKDRPAVTEVATNQTMSYLELEQFTNRIAHGFRGLSCANTDYVGMMHENSLSYLAMTYALKKLAVSKCPLTVLFAAPPWLV